MLDPTCKSIDRILVKSRKIQDNDLSFVIFCKCELLEEVTDDIVASDIGSTVAC
jgi:hypothetical protein